MRRLAGGPAAVQEKLRFASFSRLSQSTSAGDDGERPVRRRSEVTVSRTSKNTSVPLPWANAMHLREQQIDERLRIAPVHLRVAVGVRRA